jgi:hypothetical protein
MKFVFPKEFGHHFWHGLIPLAKNALPINILLQKHPFSPHVLGRVKPNGGDIPKIKRQKEDKVATKFGLVYWECSPHL